MPNQSVEQLSHILLIDDDLELSEKLSQFLQSEGYQVRALVSSLTPDKSESNKREKFSLLDVMHQGVTSKKSSGRSSQYQNIFNLMNSKIRTSRSSVVNVGKITLDSSIREVFYEDINIELTSTEFSLLEILIHDAGHVVSKDELSLRVLGKKLTRYDRSIDVHVSNLRQKLGQYLMQDNIIKTIRGVGYQYTSF